VNTIVLAERPEGALEEAHFSTVDVPAPSSPGPGEVLCRTVLLSIDPANRAWMRQATYRPRLDAGQPMEGFVLAEVVAQNGTGVIPGAVVGCTAPWQEYFVAPAQAVRPIRRRGPLERHLSVLGFSGLTAYVGLLEVGALEAGETVLVSAAGGSVGHLVGQIARLKGARVIGISGSDDKNAMLEADLGFHATVNHRSPRFAAELRSACGDGVDVYFDNVGGPVLSAALEQMRTHGRVVCCGAVSQYDAPRATPGPAGVPTILVTKRLRMQGFLLQDHSKSWSAALEELGRWVGEGRIRALEDVRVGLESAPTALVDVLAGRNVGKVMVRVGSDPAGGIGGARRDR
jgi:NADPH-dependent curcumin reductase CurA